MNSNKECDFCNTELTKLENEVYDYCDCSWKCKCGGTSSHIETHYFCLKCFDYRFCFECEEIILPKHNYPKEKINFPYILETCENELCLECSICRKCVNTKDFCDICQRQCNHCKKIWHKNDNIIQIKGFCQECYESNCNPSDENNLYIFKDRTFELDKKRIECKKCFEHFWISKHYYDYNKRKLNIFQNLCNICLNEETLIYNNEFKINNPDPSNSKIIYKLNNDYLSMEASWRIDYYINNCLKCNTIFNTITKPIVDICSKCCPDDYCHKYKFIKYWILDKVKIFENGRHKWMNPHKNYDQTYFCKCSKCISLYNKLA